MADAPLPPLADRPAVDETPVIVPDYDPYAPEPPFRPRRDPAKLWMRAAIAAAALMTAGVGLVYWFGTPTFLARLGVPVGSFDVPLLLQVPRKPDRRELPSGNELFALSGRVVNPTDTAQRVPDILAELRDAQNRVVYSWTIVPPARTIAPKGTISFDSAEIDVPKGAKNLNLSFSGAAPSGTSDK